MKIITTKKSIPDQVFEALLNAISTDEFPAGKRLPSEHELCENFGVSRPSVKTAIDRLQLLGLVEQKVGDGTYVKDYSASDFLHLYADFFVKQQDLSELLSLRKAIESEAYQTAADHHNKNHITTLLNLNKSIQQQPDQQPVSTMISNIVEFHFTLCLASENRYFVQLHQIMQPAIRKNVESCYHQYLGLLDNYSIIVNSFNDKNKAEGLRSLLLLLSVR